jgi:hypothetical protein
MILPHDTAAAPFRVRREGVIVGVCAALYITLPSREGDIEQGGKME